ncbi:hypothetical protein Hanom_Chr11g01039811 [Helianthus anomalus]
MRTKRLQLMSFCLQTLFMMPSSAPFAIWLQLFGQLHGPSVYFTILFKVDAPGYEEACRKLLHFDGVESEINARVYSNVEHREAIVAAERRAVDERVKKNRTKK